MIALLSFAHSLSVLLHLVTILGLTAASRETGSGLFHYVSRPDLKPPIWNVKIHDQASLGPGLWFLAPYQSPHDDEVEATGWIGPTIYDSGGELVWSGAAEYGNRDVFDFRINNVRGERLLTFAHSGEKVGFILDSNFTVREKVRQAANNEGQLDLHEFSFVDDGREALVIETHVGKPHPECLEEDGEKGKCIGVHYEGFKVLDTQTWETKFSWSPEDHIALDEATAGGWDYTHSNSVDKTAEGNYLLSCRHTDTIYYIDRRSGEVIWRLGGKNSSFEVGPDAAFSRQHDIRWRGSDGPRMWLTMLDNAKGEDPREATYGMSRGLRLVLDMDKMTAEIDLQIDHPDGSNAYAFRRGNYQVLPNDNIFMGWSEQATQSEHAPDGRLLMEASLEAEWLGTYRAYKFEFEGRPASPPDAVSIASTNSDHAETLIYASWNGATEIALWNVYQTDAVGDTRALIAQEARTGFETIITYASFAEYVVVEAIDRDAAILGESGVIKSKLAADVNVTMIADAIYGSFKDTPQTDEDHMAVQLGAILAVAIIGYACLAAVAMSTWRGFPRRLAALASRERRREQLAQHELDDRNADEGGHSEPLLASLDKDW